jgi:hypothetical protein
MAAMDTEWYFYPNGTARVLARSRLQGRTVSTINAECPDNNDVDVEASRPPHVAHRMRVFDCGINHHIPVFQRSGDVVHSIDIDAHRRDGSLACDFNMGGRLMGLFVRAARLNQTMEGRLAGMCVIRAGLARAGTFPADFPDDVDTVEGGCDDPAPGSDHVLPVFPVIPAIHGDGPEHAPVPGGPERAPAIGSDECPTALGTPAEPGTPATALEEGKGPALADTGEGNAGNATGDADTAAGNTALLELAFPASSSDGQPDVKRAKLA